MIVMELTDGRRIGGFINSKIEDTDVYISDSKAFLFSFSPCTTETEDNQQENEQENQQEKRPISQNHTPHS